MDLTVLGRLIRLKFVLSLYDDFDTLEAWGYTDDSNGRKLLDIRRHDGELRLSALDEEVDLEIVARTIDIAQVLTQTLLQVGSVRRIRTWPHRIAHGFARTDADERRRLLGYGPMNVRERLPAALVSRTRG